MIIQLPTQLLSHISPRFTSPAYFKGSFHHYQSCSQWKNRRAEVSLWILWQHDGICSLENNSVHYIPSCNPLLQHQRISYAILQHISSAIWFQSHTPRLKSFHQLWNCGSSFPQIPYSSLKIHHSLYFAWNAKKNGTYLLPLNILFKASLDIIWPQTNFIGGLLSVVCWRRMGQANIEWYQHFLPRSTSICERNEDNLSWEATFSDNYSFMSQFLLKGFCCLQCWVTKSITLLLHNFPVKKYFIVTLKW